MRIRLIPAALVAAMFALPPAPLMAQKAKPAATPKPTATAAPSTTSTAHGAQDASDDAIQARIKSVQENKSLSEDAKKRVLDILQPAQDLARATADWNQRAASNEAAAASAPARAAALRKDSGTTPTLDLPSDIPTTATASQADQVAAHAEAAVDAAQKRLAELKAEQTRRATRRSELPRLATAARQKLSDLGRDRPSAAQPDDTAEITSARALLDEAQRLALEAEARSYERELAFYEAGAELLTLETDAAAMRVAASDAAARHLRSQANERRKQEAVAAVREAQRAKADAASAAAPIKALAEENEQLAQERAGLNGLTSRIEATARDLKDISSTRARIREQFDGARKRVAAAGNSNVVGRLLRRLLENLPDPTVHERNIAARADTLAGVQIRLLDLDEQRQEMADLETRLRSVLEGQLGVKWEDAESLTRELLKKRRDLLEALTADNNTYFGNLVELDTNERLLVSEVNRFSVFLEERVLWIPNTQPIGLADIPRLAEAARWLVDPAAWADLLGAVWRDAVRNPGLTVPVLLLLVALRPYRRNMRARLRVNGAQRLAGLPATFSATLRSLALTLALAVPLPALIWYLGWRLGVAPSTTDLAPALGRGMRRVAAMYLPLELIRVSFLSHGLAEAHIGWSARALAIVRRNLRWAIPVLLTAGLVRVTLEYQGAEARRDSLGRLIFAIGMLAAVALFNARVFHPRRGAVAGWLAARPGSVLDRLSPVWYMLLVGAPVCLGAASMLGYSYTAFRLGLRFLWSLYALFVVMLGGSLLRLWFMIAGRNLAMREARRMAGRKRAAEPEPDGVAEAAPVTHQEDEPDMTAMAAQLNRVASGLTGIVLIVSLWMIWSDLLPALEILRSVELWRQTVKVAETITLADGTIRSQLVDKAVPVTLLNILYALLAGAFTFAAARNLPVVLEVSFLRRLNLDSGLRYAITSLSRYAIVLAGIMVVFSMLGVGWSNVQWLAAAASVGLGFGLQEILANFVSGVIILFEQPVRVGDLVTIGKTTGTVTQVRIRATTVRDWDGRDLLVPNKQLITNEVVNWTLADTLSRVTFTVTTENGADPGKVRALLLEIATGHPLVLSDPAPFALFEGFGDNGLNFKLFAFVAKLGDRGQVTNDLNARIRDGFERGGIRIPVPGRELKLTYLPPARPDDRG